MIEINFYIQLHQILVTISEPIHRNFQHLHTNNTLPVEYLVPDDLDIYRLQNEYKDFVIPDLKDVIRRTPQKVFQRRSIAKEYFQLMLAQNEIMEIPECSRYCKKQLSKIAMTERRSRIATNSELHDLPYIH